MTSSKGHFVASIDYPVWALAFTGNNDIAVAGGGGAGRSGVKNSLSIYSIDVPSQKCRRKAELELPKNEEAPMTVAAHPERKELFLGISSEASLVKQGKNNNLRLISYSDEKIQQEGATSTMSGTDPDEYQKITALSRKGDMAAVGTSKSILSLIALPSMKRVFPDFEFSGDEMFDADFNDAGTLMLGAASQRICIYSLPSSSSSEKTEVPTSTEAPEPLQVIERPVLKQSLKCTFRAARFGRGSTSSRLYTLVNSTPDAVNSSASNRRSGKRNSAAERKAFISVWDTESWSLIKTRTVSKKPVTSFDISPDGKMLAIGGADLSVNIFDAENIRPLLSVLAAHDFPSTCLRFSPDSSLLVSGSADNTLRIISADQALHPSRHAFLQTILVALLVLFIAVLLQLYAGDKIVEIGRKHLHV